MTGPIPFLACLVIGAMLGVFGTHYVDQRAAYFAQAKAVQAQHAQDMAQQAKAEQADQALKAQDEARIVYRDRVLTRIKTVAGKLRPCTPVPGEVIGLVNAAGHSQAHIKPPGPFSHGP